MRDLWPEPDGERSAYFPLKFVAPSNEANRRMLGYDAYSDPAHRSAMDRRETPSPQATGMDYVLTDAPSHSEADLVWRKGFAGLSAGIPEGRAKGYRCRTAARPERVRRRYLQVG